MARCRAFGSRGATGQGMMRPVFIGSTVGSAILMAILSFSSAALAQVPATVINGLFSKFSAQCW
jgi:hypothetical protein